MCKITGEQDIQCKIVPTKLIEAPISTQAPKFWKLVNKMVARIYHQILFVNLVIEKCLKRNLS